MQILPPPKDKCPCCCVAHLPEEPHNAQTFYYQLWFYRQYGRNPTWADAMAHCPEEVQQKWMAYFDKLGVDIHSTNLTGNIKTEQDLEDRLKNE